MSDGDIPRILECFLIENLLSYLLLELERMCSDTGWFIEYYEELADVKSVLDDLIII